MADPVHPSMIGLFYGVKNHFKAKRRVQVPRPDNFVFMIHYKVFHKALEGLGTI